MMANVYYDFKSNSNFTPYIGAGLGLSNVSLKEKSPSITFYTDDSDTVFSYQALLGVSYDINERHSVNTGYRFFGTQEAELKGEAELKDTDGDAITLGAAYIHGVEVGYRYKF